MDKPIAIRIKKRFRSIDAFAAELVKSHHEFGSMMPRSLSARIGALDKGESAWWEKRKACLDRLLEVLGMEASELKTRRAASRYIFSFPAFPEVPPLDFRRHETWQIGEPTLAQPGPQSNHDRYRDRPALQFWFESAGFAPEKIQWLQVEDAVEYEMLTRRLAASDRRELLATPTLGDAIDTHLDRLLDTSPLILVCESASYDDILRFARMHRSGSPRLIVAPCPAPSPDIIAREQERGGVFESVSSSASGDHQVGPLSVEKWSWTLKRDWRALMLRWLERHFNDNEVGTAFNYEVAHTLLEKFDRDAQWFSTVYEVLVLCHAIDAYAQQTLEDALTSKGRASDLLQLLLDRDKTQLKLLRQLIAARWKRWDLPWLGGIDESEWHALSDRQHDLDSLKDKQIIVRVEKGFDFANPIAARLLLREHLDGVLRKGQTASWAPACFDAQRRLLLDAALDAVAIDVLDRLPAQLDRDSDMVETRGAIEALFVAIGRRLIRADPVHESQFAVADLVLRQVRCEQGLPLPISRSLATHDVQLEWIAVCWAWSLAAPPVAGWDESWFFPGWRAAPCDRMDERLTMPERYEQGSTAERWGKLATPLRAFLSVVARWMKDQTMPLQYDNMPSVFQIALLAHAAAGKWPVDVSWWYGILGIPAAEAALCDLVDSWGTTSERTMAQTWWPSLIRCLELESRAGAPWNRFMGKAPRSKRADSKQPALLNRVMAHLEDDADAELSRLGEDDIRFLCLQPDALSARFKRALLRLVMDDSRFKLADWEAPGFLLRFGPDIAADLESLLAHDKLGPHAAQLLWEWRPSDPRHLLGAKSPLCRSGVQNLLLTSPPESIAIAIARLQREPDVFAPQTRRQWALARLPDARQHAPALLQML
ncbi:hypothetical protein KPA93_17810 [Burkholderia cenocepacia]|uniref:hypothetical protein n=1 Tax=Burkholderia cepacia complex TaxID=87882 RepID=UPI0028577AF0|nr:hypothetical protein [Burkholderia cenocepacia]MDR8029509.1 hypothetical protein [Burkholderia cenocepacia]MDR8042350.1 hypothetical protein [Burkholderia cenocepacia]